ncbi:MAG TPA: hypothetical protein VEI97_08870 [bacterium]|nr:hypothetical protein [bacterium]
MRRLHLTLFALTALATVALAAGCARPGNTTTKKGAGGLPIQQYNSEGQTLTWEIPKELEYPNMKRMFPNNNRIWLVADGVQKVADHYKALLPDAVQEDINGKRHVRVKNKTIEIDIESGAGAETKLVFTPLDIVKPADK